jgi:hypothetical protein
MHMLVDPQNLLDWILYALLVCALWGLGTRIAERSARGGRHPEQGAGPGTQAEDQRLCSPIG